MFKILLNIFVFCVISIKTLAQSDEFKTVSAAVLAQDVLGLTVENNTIELHQSKGPLKGSYAYSAISNNIEIPFTLNDSFKDKGHISFWFFLDQDHIPSKNSLNERKGISIELPGFVSLTNEARKNDFVLNSFWNVKEIEEKLRKWQNFPSLSKGWYHCIWIWDSTKGIRKVYINGTAVFPSYEELLTWKQPIPKSLILKLSNNMPISNLKVCNTVPSAQEIQNSLHIDYLRNAEKDLGVMDLGNIDNTAQLKGKLLYENYFSKASDIDNWVLEGKAGRVEILQNGMHQWHKEGDWIWPEGHMVHWCPMDFPANFIAEWEVDILSEKGLCIVFFSAKGVNGKDIFDPSLQKRKGYFGKYIKGDINCYHVSYFAYDRVSANLRRNPGFYLAANGPVGIHPDAKKVHKVTLIKNDSHIILAVDGKKNIDFIDDGNQFGPVLQDGKIGFRQMNPTYAVFKNFKVWELNKK